ncbi:MAG: hypothetical protein IKO57_10100 [Treponema sp.]|nr:hypothetical protein [Treponema sp.]MBR4630772.1 hypothetical protein [Treponema sp.]
MRKFYFVAASSVFLLIAASCGNSVQDMVDQYNEGFTTAYTTVSKSEEEEVLEPGDEGFVPSKMLLEEYFVWEDSTLTLSAPNGCASILWKLTDPDDNDSVVEFYPFGYEDGVSKYNAWREKLFQIYIPDSGLESNKVYEVTLTVTDKRGSEYKDVAAIVIYRHLYY